MACEIKRFPFDGTIDAAIERGEREEVLSPAKLAAMLVAALQGAHLMGRVHPDGEIRRVSLSGARALLERFATRSVAGEVME